MSLTTASALVLPGLVVLPGNIADPCSGASPTASALAVDWTPATNAGVTPYERSMSRPERWPAERVRGFGHCQRRRAGVRTPPNVGTDAARLTCHAQDVSDTPAACAYRRLRATAAMVSLLFHGKAALFPAAILVLATRMSAILWSEPAA